MADTDYLIPLVCGHWKPRDSTVGTIYGFCIHCDRYVKRWPGVNEAGYVGRHRAEWACNG